MTMYLQVIETCIAIFEMMMRDHFVLDDDYDDDIWYAKDYCIKPIQIQNKYAGKKTNKTSSSEGGNLAVAPPYQ